MVIHQFSQILRFYGLRFIFAMVRLKLISKLILEIKNIFFWKAEGLHHFPLASQGIVASVQYVKKMNPTFLNSVNLALLEFRHVVIENDHNKLPN